MSGCAWFSDDEVYRYALLRIIDHGLIKPDLSEHTVNFIMLNPSTATADVDDPTIRRCIGYARSWGYGELMVTNLFAYRATDPKDLKRADDPAGPENDEYICKVALASHLVVAAWGSHGPHRGRDMAVRRLFSELLGRPLMCLATSKDGHPKHPLYLRADLQPEIYQSYTAQDSRSAGTAASAADQGRRDHERAGGSDVTAGESTASRSDGGADLVVGPRPTTAADSKRAADRI